MTDRSDRCGTQRAEQSLDPRIANGQVHSRHVTDETAEPVDLEGVLADVQAEVDRRRNRAAPATDGAAGDRRPPRQPLPVAFPRPTRTWNRRRRLAAFEYRRNVVDPTSSVPGGARCTV